MAGIKESRQVSGQVKRTDRGMGAAANKGKSIKKGNRKAEEEIGQESKEVSRQIDRQRKKK